MKSSMAALIAMLLLAGSLPPRDGPPQGVPPTPVDDAASVDASPFGIAAHRRPPRPADRPVAAGPDAAAGIAATIERLVASGDPRDAFEAFRLIARCVHAREFDDAMKALPMGPSFASEREAYGDGERRVRAACQDITPQQLRARLALAEAAMGAGVPGAATAWIGQGPFGDRSALDQRPDDPLVGAWVEQAIGQVKAAARRNDVEAMLQLGLLSLHWELDEVERLKLLVRDAAGRPPPGLDGLPPLRGQATARESRAGETASPFAAAAK